MRNRSAIRFLALIIFSLAAAPWASVNADADEPTMKDVSRYCKIDQELAGVVYDAKERGVTLSEIVDIFLNDGSYGETRLYIPRMIYKYDGLSRQKIEEMMFESCLENEDEEKELLKLMFQ